MTGSAPARGGPQIIPRPERYEPGNAAPWSRLSAARRSVDLAAVEAALAARGPARTRGQHYKPLESEYQSGVLIALYNEGDEPHVIMTRRAAHLRKHRHEVAFPGGRHDPTDPSLWHTALREAHEEIALDPTLPRFIGELDRFVTVSSVSLVSPQVAVLPERPAKLRAAADEVERILHVPLAELLRDDVFREELWPIGNGLRPITFFELVGDTVWGATAAMLRQLLAIATGTDDELTY